MDISVLLEELSKEDKARFRKLMQRFHPDKGKHSNEELTKKLLKAKKKDDARYIRKIYKKYFSGEQAKQKEAKKLSLNQFKYWADRVADEHDVMSITKRMEDGEIVINFFKPGGNFQTLFNAQRYDTWDSFNKAAKKVIGRI